MKLFSKAKLKGLWELYEQVIGRTQFHGIESLKKIYFIKEKKLKN